MKDIELTSSEVNNIDLCWCCQQPLPGAAVGRTWITRDISLPIHCECWEKIPIEKRASLAQHCYHHHYPGEQLSGLIQILSDAIQDGRGGFDYFSSLN